MSAVRFTSKPQGFVLSAERPPTRTSGTLPWPHDPSVGSEAESSGEPEGGRAGEDAGATSHLLRDSAGVRQSGAASGVDEDGRLWLRLSLPEAIESRSESEEDQPGRRRRMVAALGHACAAAGRLGASFIWTHAAVSDLGIYASCGFVPTGSPSYPSEVAKRPEGSSAAARVIVSRNLI